ncbi:curli assembly protein CsgF [Escherichia sp. HC-CC]
MCSWPVGVKATPVAIQVFRETRVFGIETPSALDNFTQAIQSQILGGLLSNINTGKPGRMVTNDYIVDIANRDGQLQLNVTDRKTGQTSTIQVSGLQNYSTDF